MQKPKTADIQCIDWGLLPYQEAFDRQKQLVDKIIKNEEPEQIIFCSHPPVVTLGRGTQPGDVFGWSGETVEVNRGGRATYHGPNQVIAYPLVHVGKAQEHFADKKIPANDLHSYMRSLEKSVLDVLAQFDVHAQAQSTQRQVGDVEDKEATGVWIENKKIAAIGIGVKAWVTSHGVALNIWSDEQAFKGILPCGFRAEQVTNLEVVLGRKVERSSIIQKWYSSIKENIFS
jgi:lipoyl(octanoyl) transferase